MMGSVIGREHRR
jgi:hypothetical protein